MCMCMDGCALTAGYGMLCTDGCARMAVHLCRKRCASTDVRRMHYHMSGICVHLHERLNTVCIDGCALTAGYGRVCSDVCAGTAVHGWLWDELRGR